MQLIPAGKEEFIFSGGVSLGVFNHFPGKTLCLGVVGQQGTPSVFVCLYVLLSLFWDCKNLFLVKLHFLFLFLEKDKDTESMKLDG